jgi:energy-coupling factor transporter transmembrane protein EcfT
MKINRTKNSGYIEGDNVLHKLKAETKIIAALFLMLGSGIANGWVLIGIGLLSMTGVFVARVAAKELLYLIRRMACFFLAIAISPVLFTPGFYIDLPSWFPITFSHEGFALGLESSVRLLNILFISLVLVRTTSSEDWMSGLDKLLGPLSQRLPIIRELLAVAVMAVKFLPMIVAETEDYFSSLRKKEGERGYQKIRSVVHSVLDFIVLIFFDLDRFQPQIKRDTKPTIASQ